MVLPPGSVVGLWCREIVEGVTSPIRPVDPREANGAQGSVRVESAPHYVSLACPGPV